MSEKRERDKTFEPSQTNFYRNWQAQVSMLNAPTSADSLSLYHCKPSQRENSKVVS